MELECIQSRDCHLHLHYEAGSTWKTSTSTLKSRKYYYLGRQLKGSIYYQCYPQTCSNPLWIRMQHPLMPIAEWHHSSLCRNFQLSLMAKSRQWKWENLHIEWWYDAKPFCTMTHRAISFAYREVELELLQQPRHHSTSHRAAPIVVTPEKDTDDIGMRVDHSCLNRCQGEKYQSLTKHLQISMSIMQRPLKNWMQWKDTISAH